MLYQFGLCCDVAQDAAEPSRGDGPPGRPVGDRGGHGLRVAPDD
jgi:hypothetical protein